MTGRGLASPPLLNKPDDSPAPSASSAAPNAISGQLWIEIPGPHHQSGHTCKQNQQDARQRKPGV